MATASRCCARNGAARTAAASTCWSSAPARRCAGWSSSAWRSAPRGARRQSAPRRGAREGLGVLRRPPRQGRLANWHGKRRRPAHRQAHAQSGAARVRGFAARRQRVGELGRSACRGYRGRQRGHPHGRKKAALAGVPATLNARLVQQYYAGALARAIGTHVSTSLTADCLVLAAALPVA